MDECWEDTIHNLIVPSVFKICMCFYVQINHDLIHLRYVVHFHSKVELIVTLV